ncbi:MAG TPA: ABC transporter permease [Chitinophagaceae bacterium]|nr:ABC transporter permease [Chitinophagaceae bacterium]
MIRNYFKIAWRNLLRYKGFSFINILGLAIGLACCVLVGLFIKDELSYDKYNKEANRIYRVVKDFVNDDGSKLPDATTPPAIGAAIQKEIPEIDHVVRFMPGWGGKFYVRNGEKRFIEENLYRADSSIFDVFTFQFLQGDPKTALKAPDAVVLTESMVKKYFGNENPINKILEVDQWGPRMVTAVIKDIPENSHFDIDLLIPLRFRNADGSLRDINSNWGWYNYYTYIKLKPGTRIADVDKKIRDIFKKNQPENKNYFYSQALTDIHLTSNLKWELRANSDKKYVYIFGTVALFILLIACINYVNLTTARSSLRAREIGIRKVSGAVRGALIRQFLTESVLISLLAAIVALIMAQLLLPAINTITGKNLGLVPQGNYFILLLIFGFAILLGMIAGFYPALFLSSFEPVKVLKGERRSGPHRFNLRKVLVVTQFTISIALIIGTLIVIQQINFIQNAKLGLNKDHVLMINDVGYLNRSERQKLKNDLLQLPEVKTVSGADGVVGGQNWANGLRLKGTQNGQLVNFLAVDHDFITTLNMELKEGRNFSSEQLSDTINYRAPGTTERQAGSIILNETAVKDLKIPSPVIGQQIAWNTDEDTTWYLQVIGVLKDFHFTSMKNEIKPFAFIYQPNRIGNFTVKLGGANMQNNIAKIKAIWDKNVTSRPFQYSFLDETYAKLYQSEMNFKKIFFYITFIAIFIACLGLFGLSSFITEQRTKEIGIRKVLGASVSGIVGMLSKDFVKLVLIAALIAFPLAWWAMNKWLQDFVYRISIGWWVFVVAGMLAAIIALFTISFQAIRAAIANPVKSLRTE